MKLTYYAAQVILANVNEKFTFNIILKVAKNCERNRAMPLYIAADTERAGSCLFHLVVSNGS